MRHLYNYRKTYGKGGPLREAPYEEGRSLREGPVLTGALTGRPPYGKAPTGRLLTRRPLTNYRKAYRKLTGRRGGFLRHLYNYRKTYGKAGPLREAPYEEGRSLREGPVLTGALTGRPPYGKAPYGEASYKKAPYELQESLQRDFTRIGREFPLVCRRPKKAVFS